MSICFWTGNLKLGCVANYFNMQLRFFGKEKQKSENANQQPTVLNKTLCNAFYTYSRKVVIFKDERH